MIRNNTVQLPNHSYTTVNVDIENSLFDELPKWFKELFWGAEENVRVEDTVKVYIKLYLRGYKEEELKKLFTDLFNKTNKSVYNAAMSEINREGE